MEHEKKPTDSAEKIMQGLLDKQVKNAFAVGLTRWPGTHLDDFLRGKLSGAQLVECFGTYAVGGDIEAKEMNPLIAIKAINATALTRENLEQLRTEARHAYDALHDRTGPYAKWYSRSDPKTAERFYQVWKHLSKKLR